MKSYTNDELKAAVISELKCRPAGDPVAVPVLVEDYGPAVKEVLKQMRRQGLVRLVSNGLGIAHYMAEYGCGEEGFVRGCGEWFVGVTTV